MKGQKLAVLSGRGGAGCRMRGLTLIELLTSIVILAIGVGGALLAIGTLAGRSADPMLVEQAARLAQAYLEEVLLKPFCDPDLAADCLAACAGGHACSNGACHAGGEPRAQYDDVCDYDGLSQSPTDQGGMPLAGLAAYTVTVDVVDDAQADLNGLAGGSRSLLVHVTVSHPAMQPAQITLSGYRANY